MYAAVRDLDKPCITAFNGTAAGAGFQIGLCADLRVGFPEMKMGQPEIKAGLASIVGSFLMTMHLGLSKNIELSLTGELISGQTAYEIGILNHLVPRAEVMEKAMKLAADMSGLAPTAMRLTKQRFRKITQAGFEAALDEAKVAQKEAYASGEPQAAMRKFLEARKSK
jgi:enoyl-CoA hydratase/carnithine racemase